MGKGYYFAEKMAVKRRNPGGITMNPAHRKQVMPGMYTFWKDVLLFAPKPYRRLIRIKITEYQGLLLKRCMFSPENTLSKLALGAVVNNPFWLLGLSEKYRRFLLNRIGGGLNS